MKGTKSDSNLAYFLIIF